MYSNGFSDVNLGVGVVGEPVVLWVLSFLRGKASLRWAFVKKAVLLRIVGYANFELAGRIVVLKI